MKNLLKDLEISPDSNDTLRLLLDHPQLTENGWEVADKLIPSVRRQTPAAIEILKFLALKANHKEMIMCATEALSLIDQEERMDQYVLVHYADLYLDSKYLK